MVILFLFLSMISRAVETTPLRTIQAKMIFQTAIESPSHLTMCNGKLWTYSVSRQSLYSIDPKTGQSSLAPVLKDLPTEKNGLDVGALSCQLNHLLVLVNGPKQDSKARILEFEIKNQNLKMTRKFDSPEATRATDLFCNLERCWILQGQPWISSDLRRWRNIWAPSPPELKRVYGHPDLNPFEDWQATLNLARGKYTKGALDVHGQIVLLDPFHSQAIIRTGFEWQKWGSFGAWEGSFLAPKSIIFIAENTLAVADAKLKAIFLFRRDGLYLGIVSLGGESIFAPDYPLGLASEGQRLFVADFREGKIKALDLSTFQSKVDEAAPVSVRQNLFRRPEVLKDQASTVCLSCHDGTVSNQLFKFVKSHYNHPLECSKCHDPHHVVAARHYLRQSSPALCQECHKEYSDLKTNHVWRANGKKGGNCTDCHGAHTDTPKLLYTSSPQLCVDCHKDRGIFHKSVENVTTQDRAQGIKFQDGKISCITCHQTHINWKQTHFVRDPEKVSVFCASCHGGKAENLFNNFHKLMKSKGARP